MATYNHVLATTDFTPVSEKAARRAAEIALANGARLTLLYVVEHFPADIPIDRIGPEDEDPEAYLTRRAHEDLQRFAADLSEVEPRLEVVVSVYSARAEILSYAQGHGVDLIVIGTHGGRGMFGMLGSTANGVMHAAHQDILVVRADH
jgi:universal stress protein A